MDFDDLIPILIFGFIFLTSILKRVAQKAKKAASPEKARKTKPQGLIQTLRDRMEKMMAEASRQQQSQDGTTPYYEDANGYDDTDGYDYSENYDDDTVEISEEPTPVSVSKGGPPTPVSAIGPSVPALGPGRGLASVSLRQAVIWAEILGPPKALGDIQGNSPLLSQKEGR